MSEHTPGPWRVEEFDENQTCIVAGNQIIANCFQDDGLRQANARLIAAAPELLEAVLMLGKLVSKLERDIPDSTWELWEESEIDEKIETQDKANAAIAKAHGDE